MPVYDYLCGRCGPFTEMRPMAECDLPSDCPDCGRQAPRAFLTAPYFSAMSAERRRAHATNERSAHAPQPLSQMEQPRRGLRLLLGKSSAHHQARQERRQELSRPPGPGCCRIELVSSRARRVTRNLPARWCCQSAIASLASRMTFCHRSASE